MAINPQKLSLNAALFLVLSVVGHAQERSFDVFENEDPTYFDDQFLRLDNHVYDTTVHTVQMSGGDWQLSPPVLKLGDEASKIYLNFDVLDSALGNFQYSVIHCDAAWNPSDLLYQEYVDGPESALINTYEYSRNTFQKYIHYYIEFPNYDLRLTRSGNYVLKVWNSDNGRLVLTRRFCVTEELVQVKANIHRATRVDQRNERQEVDFSLISPNYLLTNPYSDLKVVILQNHQWSFPLEGLKPRFVKENELDYNYEGENTFLGGNEYRLIDIQNTRFTGRGVKHVTYLNQTNHAYLEVDKPRVFKVYLQNPDLNGWHFVKTHIANQDPTVDADYVNVHFQLQLDYLAEGSDIFVYGALTDWKLIPEAKLKVNPDNGLYETELLLKQGLINYEYVVVHDGKDGLDRTTIEGTHWQTENEYAILVYHKTQGGRTDRLLSYSVFRFPENQ